MAGRALPASWAQQGIWVTEQAGVAGRAYVLPVVLWFEGELDVRAMTVACADVVARHELLRCVPAIDGDTLYFSATDDVLTLRNVDLTAAGSDAVRAFVADEVEAGFVLGSGPLCRLTLLRIGAAQWALVVLAHHLVFDGMSKDVLVNDLGAAYTAQVASRMVAPDTTGVDSPPGPPAPATTMADAFAAQERALHEQRQAATAFWAERWHDAGQPVLPGLARLPRPGEAGDAVRLDFPAELSTAITTAASAAAVSRFEFLAAGLHALLYRYGNHESAVAVDLSTRDPTSAGQIGLFVNELPLAVPISAQTTVRALTRSVYDAVRELNPYRGVPLSRAGVPLPARTAVLPVSISYRATPGSVDGAFSQLRTTVEWAVFNGTARNALHLQFVDQISDHGSRLELILQFAPAALPRAEAERITSHYLTLLSGAAHHLDAQIGDLTLLDDAERRVLADLNDTTNSPDVDLTETVVGRFRRQAAATPDSTAVTCGDTALTYAELDEFSDRAARRLLAGGVRPGTVVALHLPRSPDLLVALLAVLKSGAAYLPLDPLYPRERLAFILADSRASIVIGPEPIDPSFRGALLSIATLTAPLDQPPTSAEPLPEPTPGDLAYLIYTSGSTGRPKGVEVEHLALANLLQAFEALIADGRDIWLAHTSLSFDISALELFGPLLTGGRVVLATDEQVRDPQALITLIHEQRVSHVQATPSGWRMLLAAGFHEPWVTALAGGEALPSPLARELRQTVRRLINCYGPTEATVWCTVAELTDSAADVTIGRPLVNTSAQVLDARLQPMPVGVPGELYVGGVALARGYRGRPELTAERFIESESGDRLYRTGDLAYLRADGVLVCLGRTDDQVKLRGHRIELGEIEAALGELDAVAQAVAVLDREGADARLVAYVVAKSVPAPSAAQLRDHLATLLPEYMVPRTYVELDAVPLTPNGKLDRSRLPQPPATTRTPESGEDAPDGLTAALQAIFCEVLKVREIGLHDDLFDLGIHSLTMMQIIARVRTTLQVEVPIEVFFDAPTVAGVAAVISVEP